VSSTRVVLIAALLSLALAAPASAQSGATPGVTITKGAHGTYVLHFGAKAAGTFKHIAGRTLRLDCVDLPANPGPRALDLLTTTSSTTVHIPRRRGPVDTHLTADAGTDYCSLLQTSADGALVDVPVTAVGRTFLATRRAAYLLFAPFLESDGGDPPTTDEVVGKGGGTIVAMNGPDDTPPAGRVGYWSDGHRAVSAVVAPGGRRLFFETNGDVVTSNALGYLG
jgi:hypothetical protein